MALLTEEECKLLVKMGNRYFSELDRQTKPCLDDERYDKISKLAYSLWECFDKPEGLDLDFWLQAEQDYDNGTYSVKMNIIENKTQWYDIFKSLAKLYENNEYDKATIDSVVDLAHRLASKGYPPATGIFPIDEGNISFEWYFGEHPNDIKYIIETDDKSGKFLRWISYPDKESNWLYFSNIEELLDSIGDLKEYE